MNQLYFNLCKVKALLVAGWGQGDGRDETHLCPIDAINRVTPGWNTELAKALYEELALTAGPVIGFADWNDAPERTKAEVIDLVQRAANRASAEC